MQTLITLWLSLLLSNHTTVRLIKYQVDPAQQEKFRKALSNYVAAALKTPGNIMAEAYYEEKDPSTLWIIERWSDTRFLHRNNNAVLKNIQADTIVMEDLEPLPKAAYRKRPAANDRALTIMLFVDAKPGTEEEFKKIYHAAMPAFRSEPGVITYQLSQSATDKTKFVTYEKFRSQEAFEYHLRFPPIKPVVQYLRTSIKEQPFEKGLHRLIQFTSQKNKTS